MAKAEPGASEELLILRSSIDNLDAAIVHIMAERFKITKRVGRLKAEQGLPADRPVRTGTCCDQGRARQRQLPSDARAYPRRAQGLSQGKRPS